MVKQGWVIALVAVALVATGVVWFVQTGSQSEMKLAPLPEKPPLEIEADKLRIAVEGHEATIESLERVNDSWKLYVAADASSPELTEILKDVADLFKALEDTKVPLAEVAHMTRTSKLKDAYGNTLKDLPIVEILMYESTFSKVNWDGFDPEKFAEIADRYWVHDEVQRLHDEKKQTEQGGGNSGGGGGREQSSASSSSD